MTMIKTIEMKCSVCKNTSRQPVLLSTNSSGYSDLDLRPPEMQRSTMNTWILECPHCGYVAGNLEDELGISKEFLKSEEYQTCDGFNFKGKLSEMFYKNFMIANEKFDTEQSFLNLHHCAWDCDDHDDDTSISIRKLAVRYLEELIDLNYESKETLIVMKSDLLRRSGQFDRLIEEYSKIEFEDELLNNVIQFQIEKANQKDRECYTLKEVIEK